MQSFRQYIWNSVRAIVSLTMIVAAVPVLAATVTSANDYVTSLEASASANHEVVFTTPSGVAEGDTITIEFETDFDTASLTEDDIDIEDDSVDLTTAATCAGAEEASVSIAADVITITICAGDGGAIAGGSEVTIEIGTNATASGTGANQVDNPSSDGTYFVSIAGTFGDSGSIALPIGSNSGITVSATVPDTGGGGGGGPPPPPQDTTSPTISNVTVTNITATSANITWTTNENADSKVDYGKTVSYEIGTASNPSFVTSHAISLTGLTEGTTYHFRVRSQDSSANQATSADFTFTTLDVTPPVISNIQVTEITTTSAKVTWTTNESAESHVDFGLTQSYGATASDATLKTNHSIVLTGLTHSTLYNFRVRSVDASLNSAQSANQTFTTAVDAPPGNVTNLVVTPGNAQNALSWTNPVAGDLASIKVIFCTNEAPNAHNDADCTTILDALQTNFTHTGLTNGTPYFYGVFAKDAVGQFSSGTLGQGTPVAPNPPPGPVTGFTVTPGIQQNQLSWANPGDADLAAIEVVYCTNEAPSSPADPDCLNIVNGIVTSFTHSGLTAGTTYFYGAWARDNSGQFSSGAFGTGTPNAPEEEPPAEEPIPESEIGFCGDGFCSAIESPEICPADCAPELALPGPECGNAVCEEGEDNASCPDDCLLDLPSATLLRGDLEFFVAANTIELEPSSSGVVPVLINTPLRVQFLTRNLTKEVNRVELSLAGQTFLMAPNFQEEGENADLTAAAIGDNAYTVQLDSPSEPGTYAMPITIFYDDNSSQSLPFGLSVRPQGILFTLVEGERQAIATATVTLLEGAAQIPWDGSPYGQLNPQTTGVDGLFGWYAPNGIYIVRAEASGFDDADATISVVNHIVNPEIAMAAVIPEPIKEPVAAPLASSTPAQRVIELVTPKAAEETVRQAVTAVDETIDIVREAPGVKEAAEISLPVLAISAASSSVILTLAFDFLPFLQYLFSAPVLFVGRRRRRGYGVVYNAISKMPIDLAIVRLYKLPEGQAEANAQGQLIRSRVTDKGGRYFFLVQPGTYRLVVTKNEFTFPTDYLKDTRKDHEYLDLYHGEIITVTEKDAVIAANVPLDPSQAAEDSTPAKIVWAERLRKIQNVVALSGVIASIIFWIIRPNMLAAGMIVLQIIVYLFARRLAAPRKPKSWGIVYDKATGKPVANAVARIFEPKYNKLLETRVTDAKGRYSFLLGPNEYFAVFEKPGFEKVEIRPIDLTRNREPQEFSQKVELSPQG